MSFDGERGWMELASFEVETFMGGEDDLRAEFRSWVYTVWGAMCLRHWWVWSLSWLMCASPGLSALSFYTKPNRLALLILCLADEKTKHTWVLTPGLCNSVEIHGVTSLEWTHDFIQYWANKNSPQTPRLEAPNTILPLEDGFPAVYSFWILWIDGWEQSSRRLPTLSAGLQEEGTHPRRSPGLHRCRGTAELPGAAPERGLQSLKSLPPVPCPRPSLGSISSLLQCPAPE